PLRSDSLRALETLTVDSLHSGFRVTWACCDTFWRNLVYAAQVLWRQRHVNRCRILFQIFSMLRSRDRHNVLTLRHHPCERNLRRSAAFLRCQLFYVFDEFQILLKILALKARRVAAVIVCGKIINALKSSGQKPAPQGAISDKANA